MPRPGDKTKIRNNAVFRALTARVGSMDLFDSGGPLNFRNWASASIWGAFPKVHWVRLLPHGDENAGPTPSGNEFIATDSHS